MPLRSQAQARYELSHPGIFGSRDRVAAKIHAAGGMGSLPKTVSDREERRRKKGYT